MELIFQEVDGDITIIGIDGGLDSSNIAQLNDSVEKLLKGGLKRIILDCQKLNYTSSAGIGTLVSLHHRMKSQGGTIKIAGACGPVFDVIELMNLGSILHLYPDVGQARLSFRPPDAD
jgi:anti-anti-sigma factor